LLWTLARTQEEEVMPTEKRWEDVNTQLLLEDRHVLLKSELDEKLQKKHDLELEISKQFEELKRLETSLEKQVFKTVQKE
jgi:hypothetical protein